MKPDPLPDEKQLQSEYALYTSKYWYNETENAIYSVSTLVLKKHKIPAADYPALKLFFENVTQEDAQKIVVKKNETETQKKTF